jgi:CubicO group peptidase (beta-lactamase class C family)
MRKLILKPVSTVLFTVVAITAFASTFAVNSAHADEVDDFIQQTMTAKHIPGVQLAVVKNNKIIKLANYGQSNLQDNITVKDHTVFPINSMTKAFTGVAIMQLVEQGKLTVDDAIGKHVPNLPEAWRALTVKQLMAHTSGLPDIMSGHYTDLIPSKNPKHAWDLVQDMPMLTKPNTRFEYNQTGYILLGLLINRLSDQPFVDFITSQQLAKVDMPITTAAGFGYFEDIVPNQARQYRYMGKDKFIMGQGTFAPFLRTAAGMSATAKELANYIIALQQGKLFNKSGSLTALWSPAVLSNGKTQGFNTLENGYAMGWQVIERSAFKAVAASGANATSMRIYPDDDLAIVVLTNLLGSLPVKFIDDIARLYLPKMNEDNRWDIYYGGKTLRKTLEAKGFDQAIAIAKQLQANDGATFDAAELNDWAYQLLGDNQSAQALAIFKLNVYLFPQVSNAFDSLGETYAGLGNFAKALENYQKVLELDPDNQHAKKAVGLIQQKMQQQ